MNLLNLVKGRQNPVKEFPFTRLSDRARGIIDNIVVCDDASADGFITIQYLDPSELRRVSEQSSRRTVKNANKAIKGLVENNDAFMIAICAKAIVGWRPLSRKALHALKIQVDISKESGTIEYTPDNSKILADPKVSQLGLLVMEILGNYDLWFEVTEEEEEGNFVSGQPRSSPTNPAPSAS